MNNQDRFVIKLKSFLDSEGFDLAKFDTWFNKSDFTNDFKFFNLTEIEIHQKTWRQMDANLKSPIEEDRFLTVSSIDNQLQVQNSDLGNFNYVPTWTTGDGNYYFFKFGPSGDCYRLRIYLEDNGDEPIAGDIRHCIHWICKDDLYNFSADERESLIFEIESIFNVKSFKTNVVNPNSESVVEAE